MMRAEFDQVKAMFDRYDKTHRDPHEHPDHETILTALFFTVMWHPQFGIVARERASYPPIPCGEISLGPPQPCILGDRNDD